MLVQGTTIFNTALTQFDTYQGQSTDKYSLQITLDPQAKDLLDKAGVIVKGMRESQLESSLVAMTYLFLQVRTSVGMMKYLVALQLE